MALPSDDFEFFDAAFLEELEELATSAAPAAASRSSTDALAGRLSVFLAPIKGEEGPLTEDRFVETTGLVLAERANALLEVCRSSSGSDTARAVESFIVFFQTLIPTLPDDGARQIKRVFYRLVPSLIQIAFGSKASQDEDAAIALRNLEAILIEIASIRLAPTESALVFRSIDHMAGFIAAADYALANEVISEQLLGLIRRNRLARSLYRLMEVEVNVQRYLQEKLGYVTPQVHLPGDVPRLADYGPVRIFEEAVPEGEGESRRFLQFHIPDMPILRDIVLHLVSQETGRSYDFRLDALGTSPIDVPDGTYGIGLAYEPGP